MKLLKQNIHLLEEKYQFFQKPGRNHNH